VDEDYTETIIARSRLDYVWVMARTPQIPAEDFERLRRQVADLGYDVSKLQKVPQRW
jgi:apolipoprotein D and lipocalin family protein